jgi:hypothetical protein
MTKYEQIEKERQRRHRSQEHPALWLFSFYLALSKNNVQEA